MPTAAAGCSNSGVAGAPDAQSDAARTTDTLPANPDANENVTITDSDALTGAGTCNGGCLCFAVDACPRGCYVSQTETLQPDGVAPGPFCSNGIEDCGHGPGTGWSLGEGASCHSPFAIPNYAVTYIDGGPDGAFCCDIAAAEEAAAAADAAAE
jgi:hypothetical protein